MPLRLAWSQDEMWKRTVLQRVLARYRRRVAVTVMVMGGWLLAVSLGGALLAEGTLRLPRRPVSSEDMSRARAVAARTGATLTDEVLPATDSARLHAWWFVPMRASRGTVLVLHGQADNRAAMLGLAELLLSDGYRVLAADSRAHGQSDGTLATYGVRERDDLRLWAEWARQRHPDDCLFGAGSSMGAAILLQALPDIPFCAAIVEAPFASFVGIAQRRLSQPWHLPPAVRPWIVGPIVLAGTVYARVRYGLDLRAVRPAARVAAAGVPVLVVHGTADRLVPVDDARTIAAANPRFVTLWVIGGAAHAQAWAAEPREYPARVLAYLAAHQ